MYVSLQFRETSTLTDQFAGVISVLISSLNKSITIRIYCHNFDSRIVYVYFFPTSPPSGLRPRRNHTWWIWISVSYSTGTLRGQSLLRGVELLAVEDSWQISASNDQPEMFENCSVLRAIFLAYVIWIIDSCSKWYKISSPSRVALLSPHFCSLSSVWYAQNFIKNALERCQLSLLYLLQGWYTLW